MSIYPLNHEMIGQGTFVPHGEIGTPEVVGEIEFPHKNRSLMYDMVSASTEKKQKFLWCALSRAHG